MKQLAGLYTDCSETDQPQSSYRFAKNIVDSNVIAAKENEDGFVSFGEITPYTVIGVIPVGEDFVVFSTNDTNSEIGRVNRTGTTLNYSTVYNDNALNFNTNHPIKGEFRKDVNGEIVVAFHDDINTPRIINIDNLSGINDIQDINVFQDVQNPAILSSSINDFGGSLATGAIVLITSYQNKDGSNTNWFVHDHVFYINDDPKSGNFNDDDGAIPGTISNKSITITLTTLDTKYDTLLVGYLQSVNGLITAHSALKLTNSSILTFTITGSESAADITLDEVLTPNTNYNIAKAMTQLAGGLILGNLTAEEIPALQPAAIDIRINYAVDLVNVLSNTGGHKDNLQPSLMPGEVYAFYLGVELNKGGWAFYHIPGREGQGDEKDPVSNEGLNYLKFQIDDTSDRFTASTNMGYWENDTELYPNTTDYIGAEDLRNTPVRHHRMPTLDHLISTHYSANSTVGITHLPSIHIIASSVNIPAPVQAKIKRWKIFFAKKSATTSLVMGSDLLQFTSGTSEDGAIKWSSGGNWEVNAAGTSPIPDFEPLQNYSLRGHSLDFIYNPSTDNPTYARFPYMLERRYINTPYTGFGSLGSVVTTSGEDRGRSSGSVIDYTVLSATTRSANAGFFKRLDNFTYLPPNSLNNGFKSLLNEGAFVADINNPSTAFDDVITDLTMYTFSTFVAGNDAPFRDGFTPLDDVAERTRYMQYYKYLTDVHVSFLQQDLIPLDFYATPAITTATFYGGDTFLSYMSYLTIAPLSPEATQASINGIRIWRGYIGYSRNNWNYRYQETGNIGSFFHGKTDVRNLFSPSGADPTDGRFYTNLIDANNNHNIVLYDPSYSTQNIFSVGVIFDPDNPSETDFPNTIIWSDLQSSDTKEISWRSFPAGNRYVIPKGKGDITNLQGWRNKDLLIHTEYSLFKTRTDIKIAAENENVFFKSVNLFDLAPEELVPTTTGYGGTQNAFACIITKVGYIFPNDLQGKIFLYNGEHLDEISTNGMRMFFRDFMGIKVNNDDNPFTSSGYTIGYDEKINRIIVSKNYDSLSWTVSYNPAGKYWVAYHDYLPDYMFSTVDNTLYSLKNNEFYAFTGSEDITEKGVFYTDEPASSYIDIVHNEQPKVDKIFTGLEWITEMYPNTFVNGQPNSELDYSSTCTHITLRSQQHSTGRLATSVFSDFDDLYINNVRNLNRTWYFDEIRDIALQTGFTLGFYNNFDLDVSKLNTNMEWYDQRKFVDKFVICRYEYDNQINKRFLFLESKAVYRYAER